MTVKNAPKFAIALIAAALHLGDIAVVAEDALRIGHHGLQLILKAESFFEIHIAHSLFLSLIS